MEHPGHELRQERKPEYNSPNRTARTGNPGDDSQDRIARTGQKEKDSQLEEQERDRQSWIGRALCAEQEKQTFLP